MYRVKNHEKQLKNYFCSLFMVHLVIGQIECVTLDMQFSFFFEGEQN